MNSISKKKSAILLPVGIFIMAVSQIASHYLQLPDLLNGIFLGVGTGLLILGLMRRSFKTKRDFKGLKF